MPEVINVTNPQALLLEDLQTLLRKAFPEGGTIAPGGLDSLAAELVLAVLSEDTHLLVGMENGKFKALALVQMPTSAFAPVPQVVHFYNAGSAKMRDALVKQVVDIVVQNGHNKMWGINATGRDDAVWARTFKKAGPAAPVGSMMEFSLGQ